MPLFPGVQLLWRGLVARSAEALALLDRDLRKPHDLLIAPTGGGKTLASFLPSLVALTDDPRLGLHTLYISPLKALAVDIARMEATRASGSACRQPTFSRC